MGAMYELNKYTGAILFVGQINDSVLKYSGKRMADHDSLHHFYYLYESTDENESKTLLKFHRVRVVGIVVLHKEFKLHDGVRHELVVDDGTGLLSCELYKDSKFENYKENTVKTKIMAAIDASIKNGGINGKIVEIYGTLIPNDRSSHRNYQSNKRPTEGWKVGYTGTRIDRKLTIENMEIDNDVNKINFSIFEALKIQEKVYFNPLNHTRVPTRPVNPVLGSKSKKSDFREDKGMSVIEISDDSDDMEDNFKDNDQSDSNLLTDDSFFVSPEIAFAHYE